MRVGQMPLQFLTVCTKDRRPILADDRIHEVLFESWRKADGWMVGRYVVMPDHVHLFCAPASYRPPPLAKWVGYWKSLSAREFPIDVSRPIWQKEYWDRLVRKNESYGQKWRYVLDNPVRAGLVESAEDWPFSGEMNILQM